MNCYDIVKQFENAVSEYAGSKYGIAVDSCTNALFLCCKYLQVKNVTIPHRTYVSVPCSIIHAGGSVNFKEYEWLKERNYQLEPYPIYDAALMFEKNMYIKDSYFCVSFSATKKINIGKGGMILTNDEKAVNWFRQARYCGRHEIPLMQDNFEVLGWNMYMTPEQAARGLLLMSNTKKTNPLNPEYPDLRNFKIYENQM